jgi:hypothetical protein
MIKDNERLDDWKLLSSGVDDAPIRPWSSNDRKARQMRLAVIWLSYNRATFGSRIRAE